MAAEQQWKKIVLPGFDGMPLHNVIKFLFEGLSKGDLVNSSAAISFRIFVAFFPTLLFLISIIPFIPIEGFQDDLLRYFEAVIPSEIHLVVEETLNDLVTRKRPAVLSVGFLVVIFVASNSINALLGGFGRSYFQEVKRHPVKQRVLSLLLMLFLTILVLAGVTVLTLSDNLIRSLEQRGLIEGILLQISLQVARWGITLFFFLVAISTLYNLGTTRRKRDRWRFVSAGATLAALCCIAFSLLFEFFLNNFNEYNTLYGSIGTLIILMIWIDANILILLIGYDLNKSIVAAKSERLKKTDLGSTLKYTDHFGD